MMNLEREWSIFAVVGLVIAVGLLMLPIGCDGAPAQRPQVVVGPEAVSGIREVKPEVHVGSDGMTIEQRNVRDRLAMDNKPGSIKHLYIISAYSGDVLIYSTVRGKVTSSGKRLSPTSVWAGYNAMAPGSRDMEGVKVSIGGEQHFTSEVLQDDGTYGHSIEYLYWFDSKGTYHQHYPAGGQIVHISDQPLAVKKIILNLETREHGQ